MDKTTNGSGAEQTTQAGGSPRQLASEPGRPAARKRAGDRIRDRPGARRARRAAEWGQQKYAGSSAEYLRNRLNALDFISQGMLFAATLLLCFVPFLIVAAALAGRPVVPAMARRAGLNKQAAADLGHLFASSATTVHAVVGTTSVVFFVLGGIAAATALQQLYERVFNLDSRGLKDLWPAVIWLAFLIGAGSLSGWAGPVVRGAAGPVLFGIAGMAWAVAFWWLSLWILVAGRISWQRLFPPAVATGVFWAGMVAVFSLFFSSMIDSDYKEYGPIGMVFALMAFLIAIGVVIILGAVVGLVWQERSLSFAAAVKKLRRAR